MANDLLKPTARWPLATPDQPPRNLTQEQERHLIRRRRSSPKPGVAAQPRTPGQPDPKPLYAAGVAARP
jgi:hypothetical protein